jgi:hypothetical protein
MHATAPSYHFPTTALHRFTPLLVLPPAIKAMSGALDNTHTLSRRQQTCLIAYHLRGYAMLGHQVPPPPPLPPPQEPTPPPSNSNDSFNNLDDMKKEEEEEQLYINIEYVGGAPRLLRDGAQGAEHR